MRFIRFLFEVSWKTILIATITGLISGVINAMIISLINRVVSQASFPNALLYFAGFALVALITSVITQWMLIHLSQNAIYQLRLKLSQNILSSPLQHLERLGESRLLATLTDDVRVLSHAVSAIPNICIDLATVIGCFFYLALVSNIIFALTLATSLLGMWCVQMRIGKAQSLFSWARQEEDNLYKHFQGLTRGIKELKLHKSRRYDFYSQHLQGSATKLRQKNTTAMHSFAIANGLGQLLQLSSLALVLFILPTLVSIPLPLLATYVLTMTYLSLPLQNLLRRLPDLLQGNIALQKIEMMKLSLTEESELDQQIHDYTISSPTQLELKLELDQVTYLYHPENHDPGLHPQPPHHSLPPKHQQKPNHKHQPGDRLPPPPMEEQGFCLGPISLTLQPGQITFIIGGNGSGKSTLAKLITGLYPPKTGSIYLDGILINEQNQEWYRQQFSAIFSDFYLFESCLGFNHSDLDREVESYLRQLQLDHKVQVKNGVLSTINLSQGQRKRLALLTAYLEDRPIYVFDEWASDQEPQFRELFYRQSLAKLKERGKAVVVITHDDRYFNLADQIIKLDYGKIEPAYVQKNGHLKSKRQELGKADEAVSHEITNKFSEI
ncbi:ATP-binding cassette domain-containing protein [Nostoc sp. FACHB-110]|uniref:ATP-binding cassette domain-containing protein n=1 Tax=Nostoc sp. FACHB-110 TaxID=2692834 RepID=UPI001682E16F|nr:ATP-binding cassette domain-containing protein [Nostoc sp. FACHB-110]MBD2435586.1 ATP-binding cassette domain-containing protein [Nostoc sp. FACHB-110]